MSEQIMEASEELDVPRLPGQGGNYRDPNAPLPLDQKHLLQLSANHFVSERTLILGQTGMGKGNAGALITEYLLEAGLPLTFIDLEGEGYSFKEICSSLLVVGRSAHADREYTPAQMGRLAELSVEQGFSVILDLSGYTDEEIFPLVAPYLRSLWATCDRLRTPYHLILDEAHELVPEEGTTPVKSLLRRIAKRGRKRGLGVVAMSQETASLDKKFLRQMDIRFLLPATYEADLKIYHTLIPGISLDTLRNTMPAFPPGTGYVVFKHQPYLVHLLRRRTFDPSETPKLGDQRVAPMLHMMDQHTLHSIDQALPSEQSGVLEGLDRATLIQLVRELRHHENEGQALLSLKEPEVRQSERDELINDQAHQKHRACVGQSEEIPAHSDEQAELLPLRRLVEELRAISVTIDGKTIAAADLPMLLRIEELHAKAEQATITIEEVSREAPGAQVEVSVAGEQDTQELIEQLQATLEEERRQRERLDEAFARKERELQQARSRAGKPQALARQDVIETLTPQQCYAWKLLVRRLVYLGDTPSAIARELFACDGRGLTTTELASRLHRATNTINRNIPEPLIRDRLIDCHRQGNGFVYTGRLMAYLRSQFPGKEKEMAVHVSVLLMAV